MLSTLLTCLLVCASAPAAAQDDEVFAVLPGVTLGASVFHSELDSPGFILGGEVSVARLLEMPGLFNGEPLLIYGGYVDALYDFGADATRISLGPELFYFFVGMDGGYLMQLHDGRVGHGVTGRLLLSFVVPHLFVRVGKTWGELEDFNVEVGITLKVPLVNEFF